LERRKKKSTIGEKKEKKKKKQTVGRTRNQLEPTIGKERNNPSKQLERGKKKTQTNNRKDKKSTLRDIQDERCLGRRTWCGSWTAIRHSGAEVFASLRIYSEIHGKDGSRRQRNAGDEVRSPEIDSRSKET
jgi:hypothetical protein